MTKKRWNNLLFWCAKAGIAAVIGTISLLALADNPWDGDELFKGPLAGLLAYGGGNLQELIQGLRDVE